MVSARRSALHRVRRNPPAGWGRMFAYVPGRSAMVRCLLCGATGHGPCGFPTRWDGSEATPAPWQAIHLLGHPIQCAACRRPLINALALASHQTCKLHHACCHDHTTVPAWKNPFRMAVTP